MSDVSSLNTEGFLKSVSEAYGQWESDQVKKVFDEYNLRGNVTVHRDKYGDGEIAIPYSLKKDDRSFVGILRFGTNKTNYKDLSGSPVYEGLDNLVNLLPMSISKFLVYVVFGSSELEDNPKGHAGRIMEGAKRLYECYNPDFTEKDSRCVETANSRIREEKTNSNNERVTKLALLSEQLVEIADSEDNGPGGWDADVLRKIKSESFSTIALISDKTAESSKIRLEKTTEAVGRMLGTWEGARACVKLGKCSESTEIEKCGNENSKTAKVTEFSYQGELVVETEDINYQSKVVRTEGLDACREYVAPVKMDKFEPNYGH